MAVRVFFFVSSRRRHTRYIGDWSSDVCSSDLLEPNGTTREAQVERVVPFGSRTSSRSCGRTHAFPSWFACPTNDITNSRSEERRVGKEGGTGGRPDQ